MKKHAYRLLQAAVVAVMALTPFISDARKIKTKHSIPKDTSKTQKEASQREADFISLANDSIDFCERIEPRIRFYGFDKTVGSNNESFFITNGLDTNINGIEIEITYTDMKRRQLHRRVVNIDCDIPAKETKRTDIKSWDTQKSFYFHKSAKPRRQATPFDVKIRLLSVTLQNSKSQKSPE